MISNVILEDGSRAPRRTGAVRIDKGLIVEVGDIESLPGEPVIDGGEKVWVNGVVVYEDGKATGARPGQFVARNEGS